MQENLIKVKDYIKNNWTRTIRKKDYKKDFTMPYDYISPCADGHLTELYYWDTYFTNKGVYIDNLENYALNNILDLQYALKKFGCVPNMCRKDGAEYSSQPPLLFLMVNDYYQKSKDVEFLKESYTLLEKEYNFWMTKRVSNNGLNHYCTNHDFFDSVGDVIDYYVDRLKINIDGWSDTQIAEFCENMVSECESGEDFTPRFNQQAKYINSIDLNSFLYGFEKKMEYFSQIIQNGEETSWVLRADKRKELLNQYCFDKQTGVYFDYNYKTKKRTGIYCVACYLPFVFGISKNLDALDIINHKLIYDFGVVSCEKLDNISLVFQWGYPNAWAPHQFWAYKANKILGNDKVAVDIADKYLNNVCNSFSNYGILFEKYDAINGGKAIVNEYACPEMLGWTAGVFNYFYNACYENKNQFKI